VKFTPDGGQVHVLSKEINGAQDIEISIRDTGIGIKQEDLPKLFVEFSQLASAYDKKYEGTGLGLALTKKTCLNCTAGGYGWRASSAKGACLPLLFP